LLARVDVGAGPAVALDRRTNGPIPDVPGRNLLASAVPLLEDRPAPVRHESP
jgi:hypothetical protein